MASHRASAASQRRAGVTAVVTVVAVVASVLAIAGGLFAPSSANAMSGPTNCWVHKARATRTIRATATATVTVPVAGPTQTVTVSGATQTITSTATVPGPTTTVTTTVTASPTGTPSATASATPPQTAAGKTTLFGAFPGYTPQTDRTASYASRLSRVTAAFGGKLGVERRYQGGNLTLPTMNGPSIISWDFPLAGTLAGQYDNQIDAIARGATQPLWFVPWHEVDNNKLAPADYVKLFRYIAHRVHTVGNPLVKMTTIFMDWSVKNMDLTTFNQFYPGDDAVDAIGFDAYVSPNIAAFNTPEGTLNAPVTIAAQHHKPLVIGELSIRAGVTDAQWTDDVARLIKVLDTPATDAVAWFETYKAAQGDFEMAPHPAAVSQWSTLSNR
jgi:hypothetical protein